MPVVGIVADEVFYDKPDASISTYVHIPDM